MPHAISFRPVDGQYAPSFIDMMNNEYNRKKKIDYYFWQYAEAAEPSVLMGAFVNDGLAGVLGLKMRRLNSGAVAAQIVDMLIAPRFRHEGLFARIYESALLSCGVRPDLVCVFPNARGREAIERLPGWKTVGAIQTLFRPANKPIPPLRTDYAMSRQETSRSCFEKADDYRSWRFEKNPEYRYFTVNVDEGYSTAKLFTDPITGVIYGDIVDLTLAHRTGSTLFSLLSLTCDQLKRRGAQWITTWAMPETLGSDVAEALGFVQHDQERYFCVRVLNCAYGDLYEFSRWDVVQADTEVY